MRHYPPPQRKMRRMKPPARTLSPLDLDTLAAQAKASPRRRANFNLHPELADPVQRLAIAMEPDTVVLPHRHPQSFELLYALRGRFVVLHFDDAGVVTLRSVLGEDCVMVETPANTWHAVLSLDSGGVIFEVKQGPYVQAQGGDTAPWSRGKKPGYDAALLKCYAHSIPGNSFSLD